MWPVKVKNPYLNFIKKKVLPIQNYYVTSTYTFNNKNWFQVFNIYKICNLHSFKNLLNKFSVPEFTCYEM